MSITDKAQLHHINFVVKDIEKSAKVLTDSLSISWRIWTIKPNTSTVRGKNVPFTFRVAFAWLTSASYGLIQPLSGENLYTEHLGTNGDGFHSTSLAYETREAMHAARDEFVEEGRQLIQSAYHDVVEFCYFEIPEIGILELFYYDPDNLLDVDLTIE